MEDVPTERTEQYKDLVTSAPDGILEIDSRGTILAANPGLACLLGRDTWRELVGTDARALVSPAYRDRTEAWLRDLADSGEPRRDLDVEVTRKDGALVPVEISAAISRDGNGKPRSAVLVVHDLTIRRRTEEAVRRARDYLREVLDAIPTPVFVKDREHRWILCNDAFCSLLGRPREVLLGRSDHDFLPKEQADVFWSKDEEVFSSGTVNENEEVIDAAEGGLRAIVTRKRAFRDDRGATVLVGVITDVTERKRAEEVLRLTAQVFDYSAQGIVVTNRAHRIESVNRAFSRITGYAADEAVGRDARILGSGRDDAALWRKVWRAVRERGSWAGEVVNRTRDGQIYPAWLTVSAVRDDAGRVARYVALLADASERQAREERLRWLAQHDVLTGLPNRLLFTDRLQQAMLQARRRRGRVALLMIDLDRFKPVNDTLGHEAGDRVLREVGRRMRRLLRESDTVARIGGDEFVVLLATADDDDQAIVVARKVVAGVAQPFDVDGWKVEIAASVGIATFPDDGREAAALLAAADRAMYRAKAAGGGAFCSAHDERPERRREVVLRSA